MITSGHLIAVISFMTFVSSCAAEPPATGVDLRQKMAEIQTTSTQNVAGIRAEPDFESAHLAGANNYAIDEDPAYLNAMAEMLEAEQPALLPEDNTLGLRHVGGTLIPPDSKAFDEVAALIAHPLKPESYCSGTLTKPDTILTAAHCLCEDPGWIGLGNDMSSETRPPRFEELDRNDRWIPENVRCAGTGAKASRKGRDFALIRLQDPLRGGLRPTFPRLATASEISALKSGDRIYTVGFGARAVINNTPIGAGPKNFVLSPVISPRCERSQYDPDYGCVAGKEMVSIDPRQAGACSGDSGGAAFLIKESEDSDDTELVLIGVISRLIDTATTCGDGAIYTLVSEDTLPASWNSP